MNTDPVIPRHGGQLQRLAERFGISASGLLDFSANINPDGPPEAVIQAVVEAVKHPATLREYPDLEQLALRKALASRVGVRTEQVIVANGFVPLLEVALRTLPIRRCLLPVPAFNEYRRTLEHAGIEVVPIPLDAKINFKCPTQELFDHFTTDSHDAILLANPQNPSGVLTDHSRLMRLVERAAAKKVFVLLDEAFIDYSPAQSMVQEVEHFPNLIVFRSLTKFYGMPGMRIAYTTAAGSVADAMRNELAPWPITTLASVAALAALSCEAFADHTFAANLVRRNDLKQKLEPLELYIYPAAANFLLLRFNSREIAEDCWERLIVDHGVVLRHCGNFEGLSGNHLRCAVRDEAANLRLLEALAVTMTA